MSVPTDVVPSHRRYTAAIAGAALAIGFLAAQGSGLRWLGAVVVLAGAGWCLLRSWRTTSWPRLVAVVAAGAGCFVLSHVLVDVIGALASVLLVSVALGLVTWALVDEGARAAQTTP